ncbi:MAG: hypothetical protein LBK99_08250 [Opitutaceae bacterium]|nr:hypothetical protein [Opitutaceae bacterium]
MIRQVVVVVCMCGALAWSGGAGACGRSRGRGGRGGGNAGRTTSAVTLDIPVLVARYGAAFFEKVAREFEALRPGVRVRLHGDPRISDKVRIFFP